MYDRKLLLKGIDMLERVLILKSGKKPTVIVQANKITGETIATFKDVPTASKETGFNYKALSECVSNPLRKTSCGFIWRREFS